MKPGSAISLDDVVKIYRTRVGRARVREMLPWPIDRAVASTFPRWWARDTFNAIDGITLDIPSGTSVGLVGHNGAGKTTLLKVIASVTAPASGTVAVNGRIAALIDALVGFHPDLTGRENAFLLGSMHGVSRKRMAPRMSRVIDFAEIGESLIETPVKRYSAGMLSRLGFAVIASLDPDILLVDEVLAVGDATFQRKCIDWLDDYRRGGGTLLFVSHNLGLVRNMTERVVWIDHGKVVEDGPTNTVLNRYAGAMEKRQDGRANAFSKGALRKEVEGRGQHRWGAGGARVEQVHLGEPTAEGIDVKISYEADGIEDQVLFCVGFMDEGGKQLGAASSPPAKLKKGKGEVHCTITPMPLRTGVYFPVVAIMSSDGTVRDHWKLDRAVVVNGTQEALAAAFGPMNIPATWSKR